MRIFVTGAAGFIGTALSNELVRQGHQVVGFDNCSTGNPDALDPDVTLVRGDINDRERLWQLLQNVDCVYHLAARVVVPESILYPREFERVNVGGTVTLLEAMRDVGSHRMVFASSGAIYGIQDNQPLNENTTIPKPASPYAVSKLASEYYINTIGRLWGLEAVSLRIFNAYGPRQSFSFSHAAVIPTFLKQASSKGTVVIHGDGTKTRDFVYITDVVDALIAALTLEKPTEKIINVGSGSETSIHQVYELACRVTGNKPEVVYNPKRVGGPDRMCADLSLAKELLGFTPKVGIEEGMRLAFELDERFH